jgi:hypothetical protein
MRLMSFMLTPVQVVEGSKDVTRRTRWLNIRIGERLQAVRKAMGRKPGEALDRLCVIEVVGVRREPLDAITADDCRREGFPEMSPAEFVAFFCKHMGGKPDQAITRIEFRKVLADQLAPSTSTEAETPDT